MTQRRQEADHVAVGAAGEHEHALLRGRPARRAPVERGVGLVGAGLDELDGDHRAAAADVADDAGTRSASRLQPRPS